MRQMTTLIGLLLCMKLSAQTKKNIDSKIEKVTVLKYPKDKTLQLD